LSRQRIRGRRGRLCRADGSGAGLAPGLQLADNEVGDDLDIERRAVRERRRVGRLEAVLLAAVEARAEDDGRIGAGTEVEV
jgi:hypothetical protein